MVGQAEQVDLRRSEITESVRREELTARRKEFADKGFNPEWIKHLEEHRPTLYSPAVLNVRLTNLEQLGFSNPNKMIESLLSILDYPIDNIKRRLKLIDKVIKLSKLPFTPVFLLENQQGLMGTKMDKIVILIRVLSRFVKHQSDANTKAFRKLLFSNLEDVLITMDMIQDPQTTTLDKFLEDVRGVKSLKFTKEEKQRVIAQGLQTVPKIKLRYVRGYGLQLQDTPRVSS